EAESLAWAPSTASPWPANGVGASSWERRSRCSGASSSTVFLRFALCLTAATATRAACRTDRGREIRAIGRHLTEARRARTISLAPLSRDRVIEGERIARSRARLQPPNRELEVHRADDDAPPARDRLEALQG